MVELICLFGYRVIQAGSDGWLMGGLIVLVSGDPGGRGCV